MCLLLGIPTVWIVEPQIMENKVNFLKMGTLGYVAGGPENGLLEQTIFYLNPKKLLYSVIFVAIS